MKRSLIWVVFIAGIAQQVWSGSHSSNKHFNVRSYYALLAACSHESHHHCIHDKPTNVCYWCATHDTHDTTGEYPCVMCYQKLIAKQFFPIAARNKKNVNLIKQQDHE